MNDIEELQAEIAVLRDRVALLEKKLSKPSTDESNKLIDRLVEEARKTAPIYSPYTWPAPYEYRPLWPYKSPTFTYFSGPTC